jgi:hypothetical protein
MERKSAPALLLAALVIASCAGGTDPADDHRVTSAVTSDRAGSPHITTLPGVGPRPIAASIVELEVEAFPRPAEEACASHRTTIDVAAGESIAAAIEHAQPGTTIRVDAGTFVERSDEWVSLEVGTSDLCIRSRGGQVVLEAAAGQSLGISLTGDRLVLEGFVLRGFEVGIGIDGGGGGTQLGITIENTTIEQPVGEFREGIVVFTEPSDPGTPVLDGLLLLGVAVDGADLGVSCNIGPCEHIWLEQARIVGRSAPAGSGADAFAVEEGRQIVVIDSVLEGASADGIDTKADDVVVLGCRLFALGRNGIKLWRGGDVINTIVDGSGADAALVGEEPGTYRYVHTLVAHHGEPGETPYVATWSYDVRSADVIVEIVNSIFYENSPGGFFIPEGATLSIRNTIFSGAPDDKLLDVGDTAAYTFADLGAFEGGSGNMVADPQFTDPAAHDYSTAGSSPARDAGVPVAGLEVDAGGNQRVRGSLPDIGPYES